MNPLFPVASGLWSACVDAGGGDRLPAGACPSLGHAGVSAVLDTDCGSAPYRPDQCAHTPPSDTMDYTGRPVLQNILKTCTAPMTQ